MSDENISLVEGIIRTIIGVAIFIAGYKINDFIMRYESVGYPRSFIFNTIFRYRDVIQILCFFFGFVLFFTGITRFSPLKKLFLKR
jgi:hypothetical protein